MSRGAVVALALLLLVGCTRPSGDDPGPVAPGTGRCHGVGYADVRGTPPQAGAAELVGYPAADAVCAAYWLPQVDDLFVPQALEVRGTTAYVGGYRWAPTYGPRPCQIAVVDLRTGRVRRFVERFEAPVYGPAPTYCRHGGGLERTREGLWVAETERLWLLDPARLGKGDPVLRVWRLDKAVRGSTLAIARGRMVFGGYRSHRPGRLAEFRLRDVLAGGVDDLVVHGGGPTDATPVRRGAGRAGLQGLTFGPGGLWFSTSTTRCGELEGPDGPVPFVPGAEDVEFAGPDLWTVSESGAKPYLDPGEAVVPMLLRLDRRAVLAAPSTSGC
ncbi:MAG: hypothetical protein ABWX84_15150 [Nocardioides sp.]